MDKTKVYTAVDAGELDAGDVVVVADTWAGLQRRVREGAVAVITDIEHPTNIYRFTIDGKHSFALAYLIAKHDDPYKVFKKAQAEGKKVWFQYDDGQWHDGSCDFTYPVSRYSLTPPTPTKEYKVFLDDGRHFMFTSRDVPHAHVYFTSTDMEEASKWCTEHSKFEEVAKAWEEGATIEFRSINGLWTALVNPSWDLIYEYRVKPSGLKWTDLKVGDVISNDRFLSLVTCIDQGEGTGAHIHAGSTWLSDTDLKEWRKV